MIKKRLDDFKSPISSSDRNKTKKTVVSNIAYQDVQIGNVPALLLKILVNKILNILIENIKLPMIFDELRDICTIPELQIRY